MRINFFEEYPTIENLKKVALINFSSTLFIATTSMKDFQYKSKLIKKFNSKIDTAFWPMFKSSTWLSPFTHTSEIQSLIADLQTRNISDRLTILLDLEPPFLNPGLLIKNFLSFFKNKNLIINLIRTESKYNLKIFTFGIPHFGIISQTLLSFLGLYFDPKLYNVELIHFFYTSITKNQSFQKSLLESAQKGHHAAVGLIATGSFDNNQTLTPVQLDSVLSTIHIHNFRSATVFRLGGLNEDYLEVIKRYAN